MGVARIRHPLTSEWGVALRLGARVATSLGTYFLYATQWLNLLLPLYFSFMFVA